MNLCKSRDLDFHGRPPTPLSLCCIGFAGLGSPFKPISSSILTVSCWRITTIRFPTHARSGSSSELTTRPPRRRWSRPSMPVLGRMDMERVKIWATTSTKVARALPRYTRAQPTLSRGRVVFCSNMHFLQPGRKRSFRQMGCFCQTRK